MDKSQGNLLRIFVLNWVFRGQAGIYQARGKRIPAVENSMYKCCWETKKYWENPVNKGWKPKTYRRYVCRWERIKEEIKNELSKVSGKMSLHLFSSWPVTGKNTVSFILSISHGPRTMHHTTETFSKWVWKKQMSQKLRMTKKLEGKKKKTPQILGRRE